MINDLSIWLIILVGFLATEPWRWAGVFFSKNLDENSEVILWVRAVSTALIAALIMRLLLSPPGSLEEAPLVVRLLAVLCATLTFFIFKKHLLLSISVGLASFLILLWGLPLLVGSPI